MTNDNTQTHTGNNRHIPKTNKTENTTQKTKARTSPKTGVSYKITIVLFIVNYCKRLVGEQGQKMSSLDENILPRYHSFIYIKPSALVCIHTQKENDASKRYQLSIFPLIIILLGLTVILCQILYITWVFSIYGVGE